MNTPVDTDSTMSNRNDWRTRQDDSFDDYSDDDDDYYYNNSSSKTTHDGKNTYGRRDSYDNFQHGKTKPKSKSKPRPASSTTHREYDDGGISDTSTHSEPPFNKPVSNKKGDASKGAEPNTKDKANQNQPNSINKSKDHKVYPPTAIGKGDSKTDTPTKSTSKETASDTPLAGKGTSVQSKSLDKKSTNPQASSVPQKKGTGNTQSVPKQTSDKAPAKTSTSVEVGTKQQFPKKDLNQKSLSTNPAPKKEPSNPPTPDDTPPSVPPSPNTPTGTTKQKTQSSTTAQKATSVEKKSVKDESNPEQKAITPITPQTDNTLPQNPAKTGQSGIASGQDTNLQGKTNKSPNKDPSNPATPDNTPPSPNTSTDTTRQKTQSSTTAGKATTVEKKFVKDDSNPERKIVSPITTQTGNPQSNTASGQNTSSQGETKNTPKKEPSNLATPDNTPPSPNTPTGITKQKTQSSTTAQKATSVEKKSVKDESNPEQKAITPIIPQTDNTLPQNPAKTGQSGIASGQDTNLQGKTNKSPKKEPPNPATQNVTPSLTAPTSPLILPVTKQTVPIASGNNSSNTNPDDITKVTTQKKSPKIEDKNPQTQAVPPQILPSAPAYPPPPVPLPNTPNTPVPLPNTPSTPLTQPNTGQVTKTNEPITNPTVPKEQANPTNESSTPKGTPKATNPPTQFCSSDKNPQAVPPQILPSAPEYPPPPVPLPNTPSTPLTQPTPTSPVNSDTNTSLQPMNPFPNPQSVASNTVEKFSSGNLATLDNTLSTQSIVSHHTSKPGNLIPVDNKTKESNVINTLPSHQDIFPPQRDITGSTFKELVSTDTQLFGEDMSDQPTTELMEKVKGLSDDLEETKQKVIKAEEKEQNSKEEILRLNEERDRISKDLEQKKKDIVTMAEAKIKVLDELQSHKQQVATLGVEKSKVNKEMDAIKKECDVLKTQVEHNTATRAEIDKLDKEKQQLNSNSQNLTKEIAEKDKTNKTLKLSHSAEIKVLNSKMAESKEAFAESQSEIKKVTDDRDDKLERIDDELQTAKEVREKLETEKKNSIQEIKRLKEKIGGLEKDTIGFRDYISQLEKETKQNETSTGPSVDKELISKIEKTFVDLSGLVPPPEYEPGSQERVKWLVASLVSWNADLNGKISINESYLHEKQTEIETMQGELQVIMNYLQHQMPTNPSSTAINSTNPLNLFKSILAGKTEELSKAKDLIRKAETDKQKMEMQIQEISRHYNTEDSKNEQLMQDNAALERHIQTLISEKEELEVKNVELINELSELHEGAENLDSPTTQSKRTNLDHVEGLFNPRPSPLYLETTSPFPFDTPMSPPHTALSSLTLGHRSTLQKAADELSHLKVKVWELEAENSKLREQLSAQARDPSFPTNVSPDAEGAFHAVFEANQVNLVKLAESTKDKEALFKDIEFLRQRVEDLEKNAERLKVSIEVKEVAYKELYLECRDWERKYKKCSNVHHELERVKRQLLRKEAESQECATLRAERLNQQTTLDNLGAELQERKNIDQNLRRNNQKLQTRLDECLGHISNMQTHIQDKFIMKPHKHSLPEAPLHNIPFPSQQQEPHPVSPTILKPPSMSSAPLSPPTRQPPTVAPISKHPPILYPPTS